MKHFLEHKQKFRPVLDEIFQLNDCNISQYNLKSYIIKNKINLSNNNLSYKLTNAYWIS